MRALVSVCLTSLLVQIACERALSSMQSFRRHRGAHPGAEAGVSIPGPSRGVGTARRLARGAGRRRCRTCRSETRYTQRANDYGALIARGRRCPTPARMHATE